MIADGDSVLLAGNTLATILSLIGQFKAERKASEQVGVKPFVEYLLNNQRRDLAELIQRNIDASDEIAELLSRSADDVREQLERIDATLASLVAHVAPELANVARAVHPRAVLLAQAGSLVRQLAAGSGDVLLVYMDGRNQAHPGDGSGEYDVPEPRHLDEDVEQLVALGLIRPDRQTEDGFVITRAGMAFAKAFSP